MCKKKYFTYSHVALSLAALLIVLSHGRDSFGIAPSPEARGDFKEYVRNAYLQGLSSIKKLDRLKNMKKYFKEDLKSRDLADAADIIKTYLNKSINVQDSHFVLKKAHKDKSGYPHFRFNQYIGEYQVVYGGIMVVLDKDGNVFYVNGKYLDKSIDISGITEWYDKETARDICYNDILESYPSLRSIDEKEDSFEIVIFGNRLAVKSVWKVKTGNQENPLEYYVCVETGEILQRRSLITYDNNPDYTPPCDGDDDSEQVTGYNLEWEGDEEQTIWGCLGEGGKYYLYNDDWNNEWRGWGVWDLSSYDEHKWPATLSGDFGEGNRFAISAAKNLEYVQQYAKDVLEDSFGFDMDDFYDGLTENNCDKVLIGNINDTSNCVAAGWERVNKVIRFCGGGEYEYTKTERTVIWKDSAVLDVAGHEFGHGITQHFVDLPGSGEGGALDEAYSDILGTLVEFKYQDDCTDDYPDASPGWADWLHGEDFWEVPNPLRDLRDPTSVDDYSTYDPYPTYYGGTGWDDETNEPHHNSTVLSHAFYLLSVGASSGNNTNDGHFYGKIQGLDHEKAGEIAMGANIDKGNKFDVYEDAADNWYMVATELTQEEGAGYDPISVVKTLYIACGISHFENGELVEDTVRIESNEDGETDYSAEVISVGTNGTVTIGENADITLIAEKAIVIWPGVTIVNGAEFHASISQ
jgi:Zn-dependent metalloprotease